MNAYAVFLCSVERHQRSVAEFRRVRDSHEALHTLLSELAANRESAAAGRLEIRIAVRAYVHRLRDEEHSPEVAVRMAKRTCHAIVLEMPAAQALRNADALLEDTVRWAIEAYYDAA